MKCNFKKFTIWKKILIFNLDFSNVSKIKINKMSCSQLSLINMFPIKIKRLKYISDKYYVILLKVLIKVIIVLLVNSFSFYDWLLIIIIVWINLLLHNIILLWRVIVYGIWLLLYYNCSATTSVASWRTNISRSAARISTSITHAIKSTI